jgi:hypothetical protein
MFRTSPKEMAEIANSGEKLLAPQPIVHGTTHGKRSDKQPKKPPMTPDDHTKYVATRETMYYMENLKNGALWDTYREDSDGWTLNEFHACQSITVTKISYGIGMECIATSMRWSNL